MSKAAKLERQVGKNIAESIGATPRPRPRLADVAEAGRARERVRADDAAFRIPLGLIDRDPSQPRRHFDDASIAELAASLKQPSGQLQPCTVRKVDGAYLILAGERRWRAAKLAGLETLLCRVIEDGRDRMEVEADQIAENVQREDLAPMDLARALERQMKARRCSQAALAERLGMNPSAVSRALELGEMPAPLKKAVEREEIAPSTALVIARHEDPAERVKLTRAARNGELSRDEAAKIVSASKRPDPTPVADTISCTVHDRNIPIPGSCTVQEPDVADAALAGPQSARAGAAAEPSRATLWGCDVLGDSASVSVELKAGVPRKMIADALRAAAGHFEQEESGGLRFKKGMQVRVSLRNHPHDGRTGIVQGPGFAGGVECRLENPATRVTTIWTFKPGELVILAPEKKDRRRP
ncbi:MAG: ParB-like partition protein [Planctomycetota bacterium]|nr:ParB-like partition protein [Planctomycetota bacterium]